MEEFYYLRIGISKIGMTMKMFEEVIVFIFQDMLEVARQESKPGNAVIKSGSKEIFPSAR